MEVLLEVKNLKKTFKKNREVYEAVKDVSFTLLKGECIGIVGESGSGKTTIARMIANLIHTDGGNILLNKREISNLKGRCLRNLYKDIQMVFQLPYESFNPRLTMEESIVEGLINQGVNKKDAITNMYKLLYECGLDEQYAKRYPHQLSGGQCQRAAIARAISVKPKILICDEATSALDVLVQEQILNLLISLKESLEMSYIFISHDISLVQNICHKVIVMKNGEVVEQGLTDEVLQNPTHEYTKHLINSVM